MLAAQSSLLENIADTDLDPGSGSSQEGSTENLLVKPSVARRRANLQEVENVFITVSLAATFSLSLFAIQIYVAPDYFSLSFLWAEDEGVPRLQLPGL